MLPFIKFALKNAVNASTIFTPPFCVSSYMHPCIRITLPLRGSGICGGGSDEKLADISPTTMQKQGS